jgi:hypothetical protein
MRKLRRIEKRRVERAETDHTIRARGSRLGFSTQVDEFGAWMRDDDLREYVRTAGYIAADMRARTRADLAHRGVPLPPWPDPDTRRAPEQTAERAPGPKPRAQWLRFRERAS